MNGRIRELRDGGAHITRKIYIEELGRMNSDLDVSGLEGYTMD